MKRLYLLTGAAGNLGNSLSRELLNQNKAVRALVLPGDPARTHIPDGVEVFEGDVCDVGSLDRFFTVDADTEVVVLHCASVVTVVKDFNPKVRKVNVEGTENIIAECLKFNARKLVYVSSTGAIPELPKGKAIGEVDSFDPNNFNDCYAKTKAEATQVVLDAVHNDNLNASIVFPSGICGPNDYAFGQFSQFTISCAEGRMPMGINGSFNMVDSRDLAKAIITCVDRGRKGEGYILGNREVSIRQVCDTITKAAGVKRVKMMLPIWLAYTVAFLSECLGKITGKKPFFTTFSIYNLARNNNFCIDKAVKELGYSIRPFEQTVEDTVEWLRREHKICA